MFNVYITPNARMAIGLVAYLFQPLRLHLLDSTRSGVARPRNVPAWESGVGGGGCDTRFLLTHGRCKVFADSSFAHNRLEEYRGAAENQGGRKRGEGGGGEYDSVSLRRAGEGPIRGTKERNRCLRISGDQELKQWLMIPKIDLT